MKRIVLSLLVINSFLNALTNEQLQQNISDVELQIKKLNDSLASMKDELKLQTPIVEVKKDSEVITHTSFGYIQTSGNTKTKTYNLDSKIKKNWDKHIFELSIDGQYADDNNKETKNKFFTELSYDYEFSKKFAVSYLLGYKMDRFSGFDSQFYTGPGLKYKAIEVEKHKLSIEGNILYSLDEIEDSYNDTYTSFRTQANYSWQMLDNLKFDQELTYRASLEELQNYFAYSKTGVSSKISDIFSAGVSYKLDYINEPALGKTSTDKTFTVNLIVDY